MCPWKVHQVQGTGKYKPQTGSQENGRAVPYQCHQGQPGLLIAGGLLFGKSLFKKQAKTFPEKWPGAFWPKLKRCKGSSHAHRESVQRGRHKQADKPLGYNLTPQADWAKAILGFQHFSKTLGPLPIPNLSCLFSLLLGRGNISSVGCFWSDLIFTACDF